MQLTSYFVAFALSLSATTVFAADNPFWKDPAYQLESLKQEGTSAARIQKIDKILGESFSGKLGLTKELKHDFLVFRLLECSKDMVSCLNVGQIAGILCRDTKELDESKMLYWNYVWRAIDQASSVPPQSQSNLVETLKSCSMKATLGQVGAILELVTLSTTPRTQPLRKALLTFFDGNTIPRPVPSRMAELLLANISTLEKEKPLPLEAIERLVLLALDKANFGAMPEQQRDSLQGRAFDYLRMTGHGAKLEPIAAQFAGEVAREPQLNLRFTRELCAVWLTMNRVADCQARIELLKKTSLPPFQIAMVEASVHQAQSEFEAEIEKLESVKKMSASKLGDSYPFLILRLAFAKLSAGKFAESKAEIALFDTATVKMKASNPWIAIYRANYDGQVLMEEKKYEQATKVYSDLRARVEKQSSGTSELLVWADVSLLALAGQRKDKVGMAEIHKRLLAEVSGRPDFEYLGKIGDLLLNAANKLPTAKETKALHTMAGAKHPIVKSFEKFAMMLGAQ